MACVEKLRLMTAYTDCARLFSEGVIEMNRCIDRPREFEAASRKTDEARGRGEEARAALDAHRSEHGC